jgi:hypothetical protein
MKNDWIVQQYIKETVLNKEQDFYIDEKGRKVMTENFHIKRGFCCGNFCLNCPFDPKAQRGNTNLRKFN